MGSSCAPKLRGSGTRSGAPPYEAALARLGLTEALRAGGRDHQAVLEHQAARAVLGRIEGAQAEQAEADLNIFRREGDYWSVVFEGRTVRVRDLKGMRYLARLLAYPGREFHAPDLVAAQSGTVPQGR
jgi:hypothetical protein